MEPARQGTESLATVSTEHERDQQVEIERLRAEVRRAEAGQTVWSERANVAQLIYQQAQAQVASLMAELAELRGSRAFHLITAYRNVVARIAPTGTLRRRAYGAALQTAARTVRRTRPVPPEVAQQVVVPLAVQPMVSIVVPVHGQWEYTERCLRSLASLETSTQFEVIVVDDASPDDTRTRLAAAQGVRLVALDVNRGYIGACNAGIEAARGEFVVLLNNDTRVDARWLDNLLRVFTEEPDVGLVGSRLIYPDGRLQEAGGIIFSDASGWNFGRLGDSEDPAYAYRRDVDYCSGASIMLRRSTLDELGGLDERYAPAYYDDTDLAFGVRSLGLRVVYEPTSVVVHYEGVSHGTDEGSGIKAYQAVNKEKFAAKWADELSRQMAADGINVQRAARRRQGRGIVVVIDHYVPRPDEDSGSVRMMGMLRALRTMGYGVLFVPDNRHRHEPYTRALQDLGIEVLYGGKPLDQLLTQIRGDVVAVIASRVMVARGYLFEMRVLLPDVPFIFDTVDLHFLREQREAELRGLDRLPPRSVAVREFELALIRAADTTLVVSSHERDLLLDLDPNLDVKVLPNVHSRVTVDPGLEDRNGLVFVGSFAHPPNVDAIRWFTRDVLPLLAAEHPGVSVKVVGRDVPSDLVDSAPEGVEYLGWVEDLRPVYRGARIAIAPLRYGAGVKGKIGEAMSHGVPVVMTSVGAEGMGIEDERTALVADDAAGFAAAIVRLLDDDELWTELSSTAREHIDEIFGIEKFAKLLQEVLPRG